MTEEDEWVSISATYDDEEFMVGKVDGEKTNSEEEFHQLWQNKVGDSSSPVSQAEDHNGKGAVQDAQSRVSGEPPKTSEEEIQLSDYLQGLRGHEVIDKIRQEKTIDLSENDEPKTVAVRIKYENSPFGWLYSEDPKYGKLLNAKREELVRLKDVEKLIKGIFEDSFEPNLKGEAKELRAGGEPADTADMLEYFAEHFKEELLEEVRAE